MIEIKLTKKQLTFFAEIAANSMAYKIDSEMYDCSVSEKEITARLLKDPSFAKALQGYLADIIDDCAEEWIGNGVADGLLDCKTYSKVCEESRRQVAAREKAKQAQRKAQQKDPVVVEATRRLKERGYTVSYKDEEL